MTIHYMGCSQFYQFKAYIYGQRYYSWHWKLGEDDRRIMDNDAASLTEATAKAFEHFYTIADAIETDMAHEEDMERLAEAEDMTDPYVANGVSRSDFY